MTDTSENMEQTEQTPPSAPAVGKPKKRVKKSSAFLILLISVTFLPALFGMYWMSCIAYRAIDETRFPVKSPELVAAVENAKSLDNEAEKGVVLLSAVHNQLERELNSTFGWSVNDFVLMPTAWLDNRDNRQRGVVYATRMLLRFYSTNMAKLGAADQENKHLKEVREKRLVYGEDIWGFFRSSAESEYKKSLKLMNTYKEELLAGEAVYNTRSDDIYNVLTFILGEEFLGQALGQLVQTNDEVSYFDLDDRIYYTQGVILVLRDFLWALTQLYPEIQEKGGKENLAVAFHDMDRICNFDPLIVLRGDRDSLMADHRGKLARYLVSIMKRLEDVKESVRR